ncbi:acyl-CoA thioester hydrolase [Chitinophaga dinghuensis]|uniref:Acyl-CoA thioester hydrolase n=1 Tax=Chitinophaga dinghuensis TaxID=1539050 RepID=A0A327VLJ2_9BACT|nr:acyl-CoA thioesterase [Chitinophaga dinghuensis]RAJ73730.1 acyl-CoA thioester hydrolase [Chitinophaga dinghuensis]
MDIFFEGPVIWAQLDANMHLRHSAYGDFAAQARLNMLDHVGIKARDLLSLHLGPILFREEIIYHREVGPNDHVKVSCRISKSRKDGTRWSIRHEIFRQDGVKAATVNVDGAWMDTVKRKLGALPQELQEKFTTLPYSEDYVEE